MTRYARAFGVAFAVALYLTPYHDVLAGVYYLDDVERIDALLERRAALNHAVLVGAAINGGSKALAPAERELESALERDPRLSVADEIALLRDEATNAEARLAAARARGVLPVIHPGD